MENRTLYIVAFVAIVVLIYYYSTSGTQQQQPREEYRQLNQDVLFEEPGQQQRNGLDYARSIEGTDVFSVETKDDADNRDVVNKRFERLHSSNPLSKLSASVTQYDVDIADPKNYFFSSRVPRVVLKDRLYQQADPFRGSIPIKMHKNQCIVDRSRHGRESQRFSALFNPEYNKMIDAYIASNEKPMHVVNGGTVMDSY